MTTKKTSPKKTEKFGTGGFFSQEELKKLGVAKASRTPHNAKKTAKKGKK